MKTLIFIFLFAIAAFGITRLAVLKYNNDERKPFWRGVGMLQVCKKPYTSSQDCQYLNVELIDNKTVKINLNERSYLMGFNLSCQMSASVHSEPRYVFCRSFDGEGNQWDLLPQEVNYNL